MSHVVIFKKMIWCLPDTILILLEQGGVYREGFFALGYSKVEKKYLLN